MKILIIFLNLILIFSTFAEAPKLKRCGLDDLEKKYELTWVKLGRSKVNSGYGDFGGLLCAGIDSTGKTIQIINYRDESGLKMSMSTRQLLNRDIKLIQKKDTPRIAWGVLRSTPILSFKINSEKIRNNKTIYSMSFKFLRNIGKGWSRPEIKEFKFNSILSRKSKRLVSSYYSNKVYVFDRLKLKVSLGLKINKINLIKNGRIILVKKTSDLPIGIRRY